jgi:sterol desaturase/sphingolipid hydroxylase (fatty acid hydroxylase superfamily)
MLNTIVLIIPVLFVFILIEWYISYRHDRKTYTSGNLAMNITIGAMDQVASLFYFTVLFFTLDFVYSNFRLWELSEAWYIWVVAYIVIDFLSYWYHRFSHRINILWAGHVTHHSSEHFNFSNGFRTSFFQGINRIIFWSVLPLFGFSPVMLVIILKVSGLYDFLLHTEYIPKLGFLEKFLITPSQHRVHHGRNEIYIDKNYGSTLNCWDKIFGTFQEETEKVEYGITGPYKDNNPFMAIGYYYYYLWQAMKTRIGLHHKIALLFFAPDRTPSLNESNLRAIRTSQKFIPIHFKEYAWLQIVCSVPGMILLLLYKDFLPLTQLLILAGIGITSIGIGAMLLNGNIREQFSPLESLRLGFSIVLVFGMYLVSGKLYTIPLELFLVLSFFLLTYLPDRKRKNSIANHR